MPSKYPGMDPFIESQKWPDFHAACIIAMRDRLLPQVRPHYGIDVEERVFVERDPDDGVMTLRPDVTVTKPGNAPSSLPPSKLTTSKDVLVMEPVECYIASPEEVTQTYLSITRRNDASVVTIIELLSPTNKRPGASGFDLYLEKRQVIFASTTSLVELDFLREGRRLPFIGTVPVTDYIAAVSRARRRPKVEIYGWDLEKPLPILPIPLAGEDPDVLIDFQELFNDVYDRAGYDYRLDYSRELQPSLDERRQTWVLDLASKSLSLGSLGK